MTLAGSLACKQGFLLLFNTLVAQMVKNPSACRRLGFDPWVGKIPWKRAGNPLQYFCLEITCKELDMTERLSREQHTPHHHFNMPRSLRGGFSHFRSCLQLSISKPLFIQLPAPPHKNTPTHYNCASCHFTQTVPAKVPSLINTAASMSSNFYATEKHISYFTKHRAEIIIYTNNLKSSNTNLIHTFGFKHKLDSNSFHFLRPLLLKNLIGKT